MGLTVVVCQSPFIWAQSEEEDQIFQLYNQFGSKPTSDDIWSQSKSNTQTEQYQVQAGDSLWEVCQTLFGNGFFWTKLWQLNDSITNPHIIYPGKILKFTAGSMEAAPSLTVSQAEGSTETKPVSSETSESTQTGSDLSVLGEGPYIPPEQSKIPALSKIPSSFRPIFQPDIEIEQPRKIELSSQKIIQKFYLKNFISNEIKPEEVGRVLKREDGFETFFERERIRFTTKESNSKDFYYVVRPIRSVKDPSSSEDLGTIYEIQGQIKKTKSIGEDSFEGVIEKMISPLSAGSLVLSGELPELTDSPFESVDNAKFESLQSVNIADSPALENRMLLVFGDVIFFGGGASKNQKIGDMVALYQGDPSVIIGGAKIVHVSDRASTAVVIKSSAGMKVGEGEKKSKLQ